MFEEPIPPYRQFDPALAESIQATAKQIRKVLTKHFNQEKPMNECQTPKPAYKPGDHVYVIDKSMWETHAFMKKHEVVFIGFDPEQPTVALVRDVGNVNAPIRGVHHSHIKPIPKPVHCVVEMFARIDGIPHKQCVVEHVGEFSVGVDKPLRIIDARITEYFAARGINRAEETRS